MSCLSSPPQLAKQLYASMPSVQVLYMSGYADQLLEPVGNRRLAYIAKPFSAKDLIRAVQETLAQ